ncbi:MAG: DUF4065 domain-containing protein [Chloroflexi bacterium]|nr:DUF4065 domain-containing protein [Chloroflexota bacterium]
MAANVRDVAQYILDQNGSMTTWKLQKLVYYCQAWSLVWDDEPLFEEPIEAWANGPVVRVLYELHKGQYTIRTIRRANPSRLTLTQKETIDAVLEAYGNKDGVWLRDLTHREKPWKETRQRSGLREDERGNAIINLDDMEEYYSGLLDAEG